MTGYNELRLNCTARRDVARPMRHAVAAFLAASGCCNEDVSDDILTAVGEALANAVEHAYDGKTDDGNKVELFAQLGSDCKLAVDVFDRGTFIERGAPRPGRGFGMRIVESIAQEVTVDHQSGAGTHVRMIFAVPGAGPTPA
jgi:anti-sigma regulatory factor (Ser/Thr protein kinase)